MSTTSRAWQRPAARSRVRDGIPRLLRQRHVQSDGIELSLRNTELLEQRRPARVTVQIGEFRLEMDRVEPAALLQQLVQDLEGAIDLTAACQNLRQEDIGIRTDGCDQVG